MKSLIRDRFLALQDALKGQHAAMPLQEAREKELQLANYAESVLENNAVTEFEDIGFCYWNISDCYALLRDGNSLYRNHQSFYQHVKNGDSCYLYWTVSDATQRLTLEKDGYADFWWSLYRQALEQNMDSDLYWAEFVAHRAALYRNPIMPHSDENLQFIKERFEDFLIRTKDTEEYPFYHITYLSQISRYIPVDNTELKRQCESLFDNLSLPTVEDGFLIGEWRKFTTPFGKRKQSEVGINYAIHAFIYNGELQTAAELYDHACALGLPKNHYIEKRIGSIFPCESGRNMV